jgi:hypothetical protein
MLQIGNCTSCGKILCEIEAGYNCTFCGASVSGVSMGKKAIANVRLRAAMLDGDVAVIRAVPFFGV